MTFWSPGLSLFFGSAPLPSSFRRGRPAPAVPDRRGGRERVGPPASRGASSSRRGERLPGDLPALRVTEQRLRLGLPSRTIPSDLPAKAGALCEAARAAPSQASGGRISPRGRRQALGAEASGARVGARSPVNVLGGRRQARGLRPGGARGRTGPSNSLGAGSSAAIPRASDSLLGEAPRRRIHPRPPSLPGRQLRARVSMISRPGMGIRAGRESVGARTGRSTPPADVPRGRCQARGPRSEARGARVGPVSPVDDPFAEPQPARGRAVGLHPPPQRRQAASLRAVAPEDGRPRRRAGAKGRPFPPRGSFVSCARRPLRSRRPAGPADRPACPRARPGSAGEVPSSARCFRSG